MMTVNQEATMTTTADQLRQLADAVEATRVAIGEALLPAMAALVDAMVDAWEGIRDCIIESVDRIAGFADAVLFKDCEYCSSRVFVLGDVCTGCGVRVGPIVCHSCASGHAVGVERCGGCGAPIAGGG